VAGAILLGRLRPTGRVEITMSAPISQKKGRVITREAPERSLIWRRPSHILIASGPATSAREFCRQQLRRLKRTFSIS
jgi:hypothetical protein